MHHPVSACHDFRAPHPGFVFVVTWPSLLCFPFLSPRRTLVIVSPLIQDACVPAQSLSHVQFSDTQWTMARQAPLSMEFSKQEYWSGLPCPLPGDLPHPGIEPGSPALQAEYLPSDSPGKLNQGGSHANVFI